MIFEWKSVSLKFEPHIKAYLSISLDRIIVLAPSIPRFKGLGIRNLQYQIIICQKSHNTVTNVWFKFLWNRHYVKVLLFRKILFWVCNQDTLLTKTFSLLSKSVDIKLFVGTKESLRDYYNNKLALRICDVVKQKDIYMYQVI